MSTQDRSAVTGHNAMTRAIASREKAKGKGKGGNYTLQPALVIKKTHTDKKEHKKATRGQAQTVRAASTRPQTRAASEQHIQNLKTILSDNYSKHALSKMTDGDVYRAYGIVMRREHGSYNTNVHTPTVEPGKKRVNNPPIVWSFPQHVEREALGYSPASSPDASDTDVHTIAPSKMDPKNIPDYPRVETTRKSEAHKLARDVSNTIREIKKRKRAASPPPDEPKPKPKPKPRPKPRNVDPTYHHGTPGPSHRAMVKRNGRWVPDTRRSKRVQQSRVKYG